MDIPDFVFEYRLEDRVFPHFNREKPFVVDPSYTIKIISRHFDIDRKDFYYGVLRAGQYEVFLCEVIHRHYTKLV